MADPELPQEAPPKKSKMSMIIIIGLLLVIVGGGAFVYLKFINGPSSPEKDDAPTEEIVDDKPAPGLEPVALPTFLVNLADPLGRRYIKLTIEVQVKNEEAAKDLQANLSRVRDQINLLLSSKSYADLAPYENKINLKTEIVDKMNLILGQGKILDVYFTDFLIQ